MKNASRALPLLPAFAIGLAFLASGAQASVTTTYTGRLNDSGNAALVGPGNGYNDAALFDSDANIANNVALYQFSVGTAGAVNIASTGYTGTSAGGIDPYVTLFSGFGSGATFAASNYDNAFLGSGGNFALSLSLAAGDYTLAIGAFANMSIAEQYGLTLADGFGALGSEFSLHDYAYDVSVTLGGGTTNPIPEPGSTVLVLGALMVMAAAARRRSPRNAAWVT